MYVLISPGLAREVSAARLNPLAYLVSEKKCMAKIITATLYALRDVKFTEILSMYINLL